MLPGSIPPSHTQTLMCGQTRSKLKVTTSTEERKTYTHMTTDTPLTAFQSTLRRSKRLNPISHLAVKTQQSIVKKLSVAVPVGKKSDSIVGIGAVQLTKKLKLNTLPDVPHTRPSTPRPTPTHSQPQSIPLPTIHQEIPEIKGVTVEEMERVEKQERIAVGNVKTKIVSDRVQVEDDAFVADSALLIS